MLPSRDQSIIAPRAPFGLNHLSIQANGLVACWPIFRLPGGNHIACLVNAENDSVFREVAGQTGGQPWTMVNDLAAVTYLTGQPNQTSGFKKSLNDFTVMVWSIPNSDFFFSRIVDKNPTAGFSFSTIFLDSTHVRLTILNTNIDVSCSLLQPHLLVGRRSGTTGDFILDGGQVTGTAAVSGTATDTAALAMNGDATNNNHGQALITEVRVYDRALTDQEIWESYSHRFDLYHELGRKAYSTPIGTGGGGGGSASRSQAIIIG